MPRRRLINETLLVIIVVVVVCDLKEGIIHKINNNNTMVFLRLL